MFALVYLTFKVADPGEGNKIVRISSRDPIREPSFDLLLEVTAGSGRLLKKYSVVLGAEAIEAAARPAAAKAVAAPAVTPAAPSPAPAMPATPPPAAGEQYGPVQAGETLWSIASRLRPDTTVTVHQTMLALYRSNPQAFENGRLDGLGRGQMLNVPDRDLIAAIDADAAFAEVQQRLAAP
ncbi:MAG: hypothetical protein HKO62_13940 [Gammaproteobacteria bacterium]|nr:hypothetical protein [Gammaproteobacteria bacterium]